MARFYYYYPMQKEGNFKRIENEPGRGRYLTALENKTLNIRNEKFLEVLDGYC